MKILNVAMGFFKKQLDLRRNPPAASMPEDAMPPTDWKKHGLGHSEQPLCGESLWNSQLKERKIW